MYLEKLLARIRKISLKNADSPTSRREPEDKFIGILSDDLRRLWVAWKRGEQKAEELDSYGKENFSSMSDEEVLLRRDEIEETMRQYLLNFFSLKNNRALTHSSPHNSQSILQKQYCLRDLNKWK